MLTLEDGLVLRFKSGLGMTVGKQYAGALVTNGSASGVTLTAESSTPVEADYWDGLQIHDKDTGSTLTGLTVEYGGHGGNTANIYILNTSTHPWMGSLVATP